MYSIGEKRDKSPANGVPGPGEYAVDSPLTKARARHAHIDD